MTRRALSYYLACQTLIAVATLAACATSGDLLTAVAYVTAAALVAIASSAAYLVVIAVDIARRRDPFGDVDVSGRHSHNITERDFRP